MISMIVPTDMVFSQIKFSVSVTDQNQAHAPRTGLTLRVPMRWCRSQKPAKSAASVFPVATGCHRARAQLNAKPRLLVHASAAFFSWPPQDKANPRRFCHLLASFRLDEVTASPLHGLLL